MANPTDSYPDNVPGSWYIDAQCICCGLCEDAAPGVFRIASDYSHNLVHHQPSTPEELAEAEDARERCPVEAIGNDRRETAGAVIPGLSRPVIPGVQSSRGHSQREEQ